MTLTLGMTIGLRRTFWMMWGELVGVAAVMLNYPALFQMLKYVGAATSAISASSCVVHEEK